MEFKKRVDYFVPRLNEIEGITCPMPEGAFYTFADVSEMNVPSRDFAREFYHHEKVRCAPGVQYGPNSEGHISARCITQEKIGAYRARPSLAVTLLPMERFSYQRLKSGSSSSSLAQRATFNWFSPIKVTGDTQYKDSDMDIGGVARIRTGDHADPNRVSYQA